MALKASYPKDQFENEVTEAFRELYTERNGQFELTGITGIKTQGDVDRLQTALNNEKTAHKATKDRLRPLSFGGQSVVEMNDDQIRTAVEAFDGYDELKTRADGKIDDEKISQIVESRLKSKLAPIEREKKTLEDKFKEASERVTTFEQRERQRTIADKVREVTTAANLLPSAVADALMYAGQVFEVTEDGRVITKDKVGVTPGVEPDVWLMEIKPTKEHWWPESQGGGARGGKGGGISGDNPWSEKGWNVTRQGDAVRADRSKAEQMAKAAGSFIGATAPAKKES